MFDFTEEEEKLKKELTKKLTELTKDIKAERSIYYKAVERYELLKNKKRKTAPLFKVLAPLTLAILIIFSTIFPVFGNNGTLFDLINTYRINRSVNDLRNTYISTSYEQKELPINSALMQAIFEKEYGLNPLNIYKLRVQSLDDAEIIPIIILSNLTRIEPEKIIDMRKNNIGWGIVVRKNGVNPHIAVQQLREFRKKLEMTEKPILIRGEVETFLADNGTLTVNTFPLKIYLTDNTKVEGIIEEGKNLEIEAKYITSSNLVQAIKINELNPLNIGIQSLIGKIVSINKNSISLLLEDGTIKEVMFTQKTILLPPHLPLISGGIVRADYIDDNGRLVALKIMQRIPPLPPGYKNPTKRR